MQVAESRDGGAIPGSVWVDLAAGDRTLGDLPARGEVVVYCACPNEASAALVAQRLLRAGFTRVRPLAGGIDAWVAAGYRVEGGVSAPQ